MHAAPLHDSMPHILGNRKAVETEGLLGKEAQLQSLLLLSASHHFYLCTSFIATDLIKPKSASVEDSWQQIL